MCLGGNSRRRDRGYYIDLRREESMAEIVKDMILNRRSGVDTMQVIRT